MKLRQIWNKKIGIYCIKNSITNKNYVGSSINILGRLYKHRALLRHNKHQNSYLQNSWNKHSEEYFTCFILEICNIDELIVKEQFWIDKLGDYNLTKEVIRLKLSDESKQKMSFTRKNKIASGEIPKYGSKKIKKYSKNGDFIKEYNSITDASNDSNISTCQISRVLKKRHVTAGGYQWKYSTDNSEIKIYNGRDHKKEALKRRKALLVLDTYTGIYYNFNSYKETEQFFNVKFQTISRAIKNTRNLYKNRYLIQPDLIKQEELLETPKALLTTT